MVHRSEGILQYGSGDRAVLLVDQGLADYYRRLIPKYIDVRPQRHAAHVTVVRGGHETPDPATWGKYEGEVVPFAYTGEVFLHDGYFYLRVDCDRLDTVRLELRLPRHFDTVKGHHITIGNSR